ncbi:MAG TPA: hypothetical protein VE967_16255, partial [Gemmatimonadaceae bacterium]|nr:hypothetical protein [Gemmatimonadaceae bacterium]
GGGGGRGGGGGGGAGGRGGRGGADSANAVPVPLQRPRPPGSFGNIISGLTQPEALRFQWNTPFMLSPHNPNTLLIGSNRFHRSDDRGDNWTASPDLTKAINRETREIMGVLPGGGRGGADASRPAMIAQHDGVQSYSNLVTIAESPVLPGLYWTGADDGNLETSRDGGLTWTNVTDRVTGSPKECYVSRVEPSHFDAATNYVSFDCHRNDDHKPYVYVTHDYGQTWKSIAANLPTPGNVNVIKEDIRNPNLLFVGTEYAFWVSLDAGNSWKKFMNNLPVVRIDDVLIHPRENDLVLATHGRSVWIMDDITPLEQMTPAVQSSDFHLFDLRPTVAWIPDIQMGNRGRMGGMFTGENPPRGVAINYYLKSAPSGDVSIRITDAQDAPVYVANGTRNVGLNRVQWTLVRDTVGPRGRGNADTTAAGGRGGGGGGGGRGGGGGVEAGTYLVTLTVNGKSMSKPVIVIEDVWLRK